MPFIPKSTGIPTVDKVFKEVFAILNRFQGGGVASSSGEPVSWFDIINKPTTFPPESHTQDISTINNLQTALDSKEPVIALGTGNKYLFRDKTWKEIDWDEIINKPSSFTPSAHTHLWSEISDKPSVFTPSAHSHAIADITSLQAALDDKQPIHANLTSISNLSTTPSGRFLVTNGSAIVARPLQNSDLPAIAITDTFVVSSQAAMLALSAAERGDIAVRSDLNKSFILKGDDYSKLEDWQELLTPTDAVLSVDGRTGVVSLSDKYQPLDTDLTTIAGLTHSNRHVLISNGSTWTRRALEEADLPSLSISKITGLQSVLDGKSNTGHSHTWSEITGKPSTFTPSSHGLVSSTHTVSGLTTGHFLKALSANTYGFAAITWSEITGKPSTFTPSAHTLVSHTDWSTYFDQALKTTSTPTFAKLVLGTRPANDHRWTLALDNYNTFYSGGTHMNIMHNLYYDGSNWRYRYGSTNSGGVITTLAYNQFSVQVASNSIADGIATLTPAIFTNLSGNTAFGKNSFVGGNRLEVEGNAYINGYGYFTGQVDTNNINNTGFLQNTGYIASIYPSNSSVYYRDVCQYSVLETNITGTMKFILPKSWSNTMLTFTIKGYNYATGQGAWECVIGGCNDGAGWKNCSAEIRGAAPFSQVRLAHDGSKCVLLLGTTSTAWRHPQVAITEVFASYHNVSGWGEPYSMEFITSESGLTNIVTPTVNSGVGADWNALINKPSTFTPSAHTHPWADITDKPSTFAPAEHGLVSSTHTVSGLTTGHVLKATGATTYGFAALTPSEIGAPAIGTERSLSVTTAGWVTIATCATGRAYGEFHVYDSTSGRHNFTKIIASTSYGMNNVSVIGGNRYSSTRSIAHVRVLYNTSDRTYGGAKLQVYCENPTFTLYVKQFLSQEFTNWKAWNNATPVAEGTPTGWAQDDSTYLQDITNPNYSFVGNVFSGKELLLSGNATITGNIDVGGNLQTRNNISLLNKAGTGWLSFATRDVSGSEAKFSLSNISGLAMEAVSPFLTITPYSNGGIVFNTPSGPVGQHAHWITRSANDGVLRISREFNGEGSLMMAFAPTVNEILINSDVYFSQKNLFDVCLSGTVNYNGILHIVSALGPIDTDNYPGIELAPNPSSSYDFTLTGGIFNQRIFVRNISAHVQYVDGCRIEPGQFRDFIKTGTSWTASGASIPGKTTYVSHGTGSIGVNNVSTVHINYTPTSTYTLTNGYVGQRVTVVVLSESAQHWIHGATKVHKIVPGEFRDFIYTTDGWVASAADY